VTWVQIFCGSASPSLQTPNITNQFRDKANPPAGLSTSPFFTIAHLLNDVGQLVGQQFFAFGAIKTGLTTVEEDIMPVSEGSSLKRFTDLS
jgi:hypothetical protein